MNWWHHFTAWLRGDLDQIVSGFDKLYAKLNAHVVYKNTLASEQLSQASALQQSAAAHSAEANAAATIRNNIGALIGK